MVKNRFRLALLSSAHLPALSAVLPIPELTDDWLISFVIERTEIVHAFLSHIQFWSLLSLPLDVITLCSVLGVGERTCCPGSAVGRGLTLEAAVDLGLEPGMAVGASLIDAHAGGLGQLYSRIINATY